MNAFLSGAAGALAVLLALALAAALLRRAVHRRFRRGRHLGVRHLLRRIGARPDQERLVLEETDALAEELRALRSDAAALREDLASLLAGPALDPARISGALDARLAGLGRAKARATQALARIHAALDEEQRARLAGLVRSGPRHRCAGAR